MLLKRPGMSDEWQEWRDIELELQPERERERESEKDKYLHAISNNIF
jgi:hypothetical protein